jgi:hypothetical protein
MTEELKRGPLKGQIVMNWDQLAEAVPEPKVRPTAFAKLLWHNFFGQFGV